jgi:hypothetical protein
MKVPGIEVVSGDEDGCDENVLENKGRDDDEGLMKGLDGAEKQVLSELMRGAGAGGGVSVGVIRGNDTNGGDCATGVSGPKMYAPLQRAGITSATLANALYDGLNATKVLVVKGRTKRVPDHAVRLKYLELAHKLRGDYPAALKEAEQHNQTYEARIMTVMSRVQGSMTKAIISLDNKDDDVINVR